MTIPLSLLLCKADASNSADEFNTNVAADKVATTLKTLIEQVLSSLPHRVTAWITIKWEAAITVMILVSGPADNGQQSAARWRIERPSGESMIVWTPASRVRLLIGELVNMHKITGSATVCEVRSGLIRVSI
jgi:hypothetical protein